MTKFCLYCNKRAYSDYCVQHKSRTPIKQVGKRTELYNKWRDTVAKPYLNSTKGEKCELCNATTNLDVDHIQKRGSNPALKFELTNVRYLCRKCHYEET